MEPALVKCIYSHGGMYEDDFWPFDLYKYDSQTGSYVHIASVNSTQLLHDYETGELDDELNKDFPYAEDKDNDGKIYSIWFAGSQSHKGIEFTNTISCAGLKISPDICKI